MPEPITEKAAPPRDGREVPEYTIRWHRPKSSRYVVAIFVINEGQKLLRQLDKMKPLAARIDIVIADGGSTDGSTSVENLESRAVRALLTKTGPGKLSAQMRMAMDWAMNEGYDGLITIDGNDKDDSAAIDGFMRALDEGFDHVQGSRFIPGGKAINTPPSRFWGIKILHAPLISLAAGFRYTDTTNGFRAYSRRFLLDSRVRPFRDVFVRYEMHYYLAIRAARLGFRCLEIPVTRAYPDKGPTPTKISPIRGNLLVLKTLFQACTYRWDPTDGDHAGKK